MYKLNAEGAKKGTNLCIAGPVNIFLGWGI
jgi:hypothetical protein